LAEFTFYATLSDRRDILTELIGMGGLVVFQSVTTTQPVAPIVSEETLEKVLASGRRQFFLSSGQEGALPAMRAIVSGEGAGKWFIDVSEQPSLIGVELPPHYEEQGMRLGPGKIWFPASRNPMPPPVRASARKIYENVIGKLKASLLRTATVARKRLWLTDQTLVALSGGAKILVDGVWYSSADIGREQT